ncbi:TetR/AcrR family transcriptional regulator [Ancylobacter terrae]|uniref:TetR/AcrR family transcriptional regulator n=1 Tax=Ancylobacter sp. sgz301288 TaxID=3342077 RepID=UPI00385BD482
MSPRAARQRLKPERRAELILEEALGLFAQRHFSIVTVRDIALRCGINVGLIYHYFDNKEHLVRASLEHAIAQMMAGYDALRADPDDPLGAIGPWLDMHATIAPTIARMVKVMADYAASGTRDDAVDRAIAGFYAQERRLLEETLAEGMAAGRFRTIDAPRLARLVGLHLDGIFHASASRGDDRIKEDIAELRAFLAHYLGIEAAAPQR